MYRQASLDELEDLAEVDCYMSQIFNSTYEQVDPEEVARQQTHLTKQQQKQLANLLQKFEKLFCGELGKYEEKRFT